jgi:hypothetical protein
LANIINGVILALIFCSPVSGMFESKGMSNKRLEQPRQ